MEWLTVGTYEGVGTSYTLEIAWHHNEDGGVIRLTASSGPGSGEVERDTLTGDRSRDLAIQERMAIRMVTDAINEVRAEAGLS